MPQGNAVKGGPAVAAVAAEGPALDLARQAVGRDAASVQAAAGQGRAGRIAPACGLVRRASHNKRVFDAPSRQAPAPYRLCACMARFLPKKEKMWGPIFNRPRQEPADYKSGSTFTISEQAL